MGLPFYAKKSDKNNEKDLTSCVCEYCQKEMNLAYRISRLSKEAPISQCFKEISDWENDAIRHQLCVEIHAKSGRLTTSIGYVND